MSITQCHEILSSVNSVISWVTVSQILWVCWTTLICVELHVTSLYYINWRLILDLFSQLLSGRDLSFFLSLLWSKYIALTNTNITLFPSKYSTRYMNYDFLLHIWVQPHDWEIMRTKVLERSPTFLNIPLLLMTLGSMQASPYQVGLGITAIPRHSLNLLKVKMWQCEIKK